MPPETKQVPDPFQGSESTNLLTYLRLLWSLKRSGIQAGSPLPYLAQRKLVPDSYLKGQGAGVETAYISKSGLTQDQWPQANISHWDSL